MKRAKIAVVAIVMFAIVAAAAFAIIKNNEAKAENRVEVTTYRYDPEATPIEEYNFSNFAEPTFDEEVGDELYSLGCGAYYDRDNARVVLSSSAKKNNLLSEKELEYLEQFSTIIDPKADSFDPACLARTYAAYALKDERNYVNAVNVIWVDIMRDEAYAEQIFVELMSDIQFIGISDCIYDYSSENYMP